MTVYNMPIWMRNITFRFIESSLEQESEARNSATGNTSSTTNLDWANPDRSKVTVSPQVARVSKK